MELQDLGAFWSFVESGASLEAASRQALALLPEIETTAGALAGEIDSKVLGITDAAAAASPAAAAAAAAAGGGGEASAARKQRLRGGLAGAVAKLGGEIPEPVRVLLAEQGGLKGINDAAVAGLSGIGLAGGLQSFTVVSQASHSMQKRGACFA